MPYRGLGSGIPRVMAAGIGVELIDRLDGNLFVARIWRTTQKDNEELISAIQKEGNVTQKNKTTTRKPLNTAQKRILDYLDNYSNAT